MPNSVITDLIARDAGFTANLNKMQSSVQGFGRSISLGMLGGIGAGIGLTAMLGKSVTGAMEAEAAGRKLEAVLAATGGAIGLTAAELSDYAAELQRVTNFEDDATVAAMAVLATHKNVGPVFKEATALAQDMATVLGSDLTGAMQMLGKALDDPSKGMMLLGRSVGGFTDKQEQMIKSLQESGDLLGAQRIILDKLKGSFGGAAQAMASPFAQAKNAVGYLGEVIGVTLLPALKELAVAAKSSAESMTDAAKSGKETNDMGMLLADTVFALTGGLKLTATAFASVALGAYQIANAFGLASDETVHYAEQNVLAAKESFQAWANAEWPHEKIATQAEKTQKTFKGIADATGDIDAGLKSSADKMKALASSAEAFFASMQSAVRGFGMTPERAKLADFRAMGMDPDMLARMELEVETLEKLRDSQTEAERGAEELLRAEIERTSGMLDAALEERDIERIRAGKELEEMEDAFWGGGETKKKAEESFGGMTSLEGLWSRIAGASAAGKPEEKTAANTERTARAAEQTVVKLDQMASALAAQPPALVMGS